jgi:hypothetical protein
MIIWFHFVLTYCTEGQLMNWELAHTHLVMAYGVVNGRVQVA